MVISTDQPEPLRQKTPWGLSHLGSGTSQSQYAGCRHEVTWFRYVPNFKAAVGSRSENFLQMYTCLLEEVISRRWKIWNFGFASEGQQTIYWPTILSVYLSTGYRGKDFGADSHEPFKGGSRTNPRPVGLPVGFSESEVDSRSFMGRRGHRESGHRGWTLEKGF